MTPEQLAQDPAVRAAVFATVTTDEARAVLSSRQGAVWADQFAEYTAELLILMFGAQGTPEAAAVQHDLRALRMPGALRPTG